MKKQEKTLQMQKAILVICFWQTVSIVSAQPASNYSLKSTGGSITLTGEAASSSNTCTQTKSTWTIYGFNNSFSSFSGTSCNNGGCTLSSEPKTYSVSPGVVGNVQSVNYDAEDDVVQYGGGCSASLSSSPSTVKTISITTYEDLTATGTLPSSICANASSLDLTKYISISSSLLSGVTWEVDGAASTSTFNPGDYSIGAHEIRASYAFDNGTTLVTVGTINVNESGTGGITFSGSQVSNGNTINSCVGDSPINLGNLVNIPDGTWNTVSGSGLSSSGGSIFFTPDQLSDIHPNQFSYTVMMANGCTGTNYLQVYVKDNQNPPTVTGLPAAVCPDAAVNLEASVSAAGTYHYKWYKAGQSKPFDSISNPLKYIVIHDETLNVRSVNTSGCISSATPINITTPFPEGIITVDKNVITQHDQVHFSYSGGTSGNSLRWDFGDGLSSSELNPVHHYDVPGTYSVSLTITSALGCSTKVSYSSVTVNKAIIDAISGPEPKTIIVSPVPFADVLRVTSGEVITAAKMIDALGREIDAREVNAKAFEIKADYLVPGVYILVLYSETQVSSVKVVKQ